MVAKQDAERAAGDARRAMVEAQTSDRAKSEFLANMSHELRTPLNAILGFSEIMKKEMLGPLGTEQYNQYVEDIHESGRYLLDVISDILDISRIEAARPATTPLFAPRKNGDPAAAGRAKLVASANRECFHDHSRIGCFLDEACG